MGKTDVVQTQKAAVLAGQDAALQAGLEACYDQGVADAAQLPAGGFTQSDVEAAVAKAVAPLNDQIVAAQAALADMTAKEQSEEQLAAGYKATIDKITAILNPAPAETPAPAQG